MTTKKKSTRRRFFRPIPTTYEINLKSFKFWRNAFLIFWIFSFIGHLLEYAWAALPLLFGQPSHIDRIPFFVVAAPYGLGALALIWLVWPFVLRGRIGIVATYALSVIVTTSVEFICAAAVVFLLGYNPFWNYSNQPFNLFGYVCLPNSLAFGIVSVLMLYYVFPILNNFLNKIKRRWLDIVFWILFVSYTAVQISRFFSN
ncbi:putative ABC transporter permease [Candidatus Saccharibacteria bacterium]|nr:putative ABC transporter permease [Candidatus Saccharibacteria bacterium]